MLVIMKMAMKIIIKITMRIAIATTIVMQMGVKWMNKFRITQTLILCN